MFNLSRAVKHSKERRKSLPISEAISPLKVAGDNSRVGKGISAQAPHRTVLETLTSHGSSHSVIEKSTTLLN